MRNDSLINQKKNDINNKSDIIFNSNKNIIDNIKNNCKNIINNESKNNENQNELIKKFNKLNININENRKENNNLFNNYIGYNPRNGIKNRNILNTINYIGSYNTDYKLNNYKASFSMFSNPKKISSYNSMTRCVRYDNLDFKEDNLRDKILKGQNNENNQKISLPNLNICNKENKRNLSLNKKYNKISINKLPQRNISHSSIKKASYSLHHYNGLKDSIENLDKIKIDLFSSISKSSNFLIPLISSKNNNYLEYENNKNEEQKNIKYSDIIIKNENDNNNIRENSKNNKDSNNKLKNINKKINLDTNNYNLLLNFDKSFITKLHKIKIEKGIMGNKIFEKLNKNLLNKEYNGLVTFENNITDSKLPLINGLHKNNITKNRINQKIKIKLK